MFSSWAEASRRCCKPFYEHIQQGLPQWCVNPRAYEIPLLIAHYGADAGIAGGAALCARPFPKHELLTSSKIAE